MTDDQREFELWLNGLTVIEKHDGHFQDVRQKHAEFHRVAASVLEAATEGRGKEAQRMLDEDGEFPEECARYAEHADAAGVTIRAPSVSEWVTLWGHVGVTDSLTVAAL